MAQDNGYYFFKYCMENLDEKEKKNIMTNSELKKLIAKVLA